MSKRIALIDSGIGGTSLLSELLSRNISAEIFYQADSENVPYGEKSQGFMLVRMSLMIDALPDVDAIVIACNTLTAETIESLRRKSRIPIFGIEPFIKYIEKVESEENVGLILTPATFKSERFKILVSQFDPDGRIQIFALPKLAMLIENFKKLSWGEIETELAPIVDKKLDKLILGCTHYPLIANFIEDYLKVKTVDPNSAVANHIIKSLELSEGRATIQFRFNLSEEWSHGLNLPLIEERSFE